MLWNDAGAAGGKATPGDAALAGALAGLAPGHHLCLIYETPEEQLAAVVPFLRIGLDRGERCLYVADGHTVNAVAGALRSGGADTDAAFATGALVIAGTQETYFREGRFDPDTMIEFLARATAEARGDGYSALRIAGEATWALGGDPGSERLLEYEAKLDWFFHGSNCLALCLYNRRLFSAALVRDVIRTHRLVTVGGTVCRNFYFVPPEEFLSPHSAEGEVERLLGQLVERERADAALRESEARYQALAEAAQDAIFVIDRDDRVRYVNRFAAGLFGKRPEELIGRPRAGLFPTGEGRRLASLRRVRTSGEPLYTEARTPFPGGERWLGTWLVPLRDQDGRVDAVMGISRDVSEGRHREETLRRHDAILEALAGAGNALLFEREWSAGVRELLDRLGVAAAVSRAYLFENEALADGALATSQRFEWVAGGVTPQIDNPELQGFAYEAAGFGRWVEVLGRGEVICGDVSDFPAAERKVLGSQGIVSMLVVPIHVEGRWWGFIGFDECAGKRAWETAEATALRLAADTIAASIAHRRDEEALREREARVRALVDGAPDGVVAIDAGGTIEWFNLAAARMFGYTAEEAIGRNVAMLMPEPHRSEHQGYVSRYLATGEARIIGSIRRTQAQRKDGTTFPIELSITEVASAGKRGFLGILRDMTHQERLEEQLRQTQKMEAIGRLAGGVAHDFNNILQAMASLSGVVRAQGGLPVHLSETLEELEEQVRRGASLTRQLLLFSRREVAKLEPLDLGELASGMTRMLRRLIRENIRFSVTTEAQPCLVQADRGQLEQVLMNLTLNASDAMPQGGELTIRTGRLDEKWVWFEVTDTGCGMREEVRARIFEPFFTTKPAGTGTGLGLAVVHGIVARHEGRIEVSSSPGTGSSFRVLLPAAPPAPADERLDDAPGALEAARGERILLVEDEDGARRALGDLLAALGYKVVALATAEEAFGLSRESQFDLLLTDLLLPGVSGVDLALGLQSRWPSLRLVLMSGYTEDEVAKHAVLTGRVRFLQKPFGIETLARELRAALA